MTPRPGIEPGANWWEGSALTTAPSPLPKFGVESCKYGTAFGLSLSNELPIIRVLNTLCKCLPDSWDLIARLLKDYISGNGRLWGNDPRPKGEVGKAKLFERGT